VEVAVVVVWLLAVLAAAAAAAASLSFLVDALEDGRDRLAFLLGGSSLPRPSGGGMEEGREDDDDATDADAEVFAGCCCEDDDDEGGFWAGGMCDDDEADADALTFECRTVVDELESDEPATGAVLRAEPLLEGCPRPPDDLPSCFSLRKCSR
jgi:hypothetical protein